MQVRLQYVARAIDPISHSAGVDGNETLLRTEEIIDSFGEKIRIPLGVSGNSIKHNWLRQPGAEWMLQAMGVEQLDLPVIHLLWSGGPKMNKASKFTLEDARRIETLCPIVSALGYSAGNHMEEGKIEVSDLRVVCRELLDATPTWAIERCGLAEIEDGDYYRTRRMMTRHQATEIKSAQRYMLEAAKKEQEELLKAKAKDAAKSAREAKGDSTQMLAFTQCLAIGTWFWGEMVMRDLTELERWAVGSALHHANYGGDDRDGSIILRVGGKRNSGFGRVKVWFEVSHSDYLPTAREWSESKALDRQSPGIRQLREHYRANRDAIIEALGGIYA